MRKNTIVILWTVSGLLFLLTSIIWYVGGNIMTAISSLLPALLMFIVAFRASKKSE